MLTFGEANEVLGQRWPGRQRRISQMVPSEVLGGGGRGSPWGSRCGSRRGQRRRARAATGARGVFGSEGSNGCG